MRVAQQFSSRSSKLDLAAVAYHSPSTFLAAPCPGAVVVDAVVIGTQRGEVRWIGLPAILVRINVVYLASVCWDLAVWPRADEVFCDGQYPLLA